MTVPEALELSFPGVEVERRTAFLTEAELEEARRLAGDGVEVTSSLVTYYVGLGPDGPIGVAYFDAHRVRTLPEVVMFVITPGSTIERIEILKFQEPPEYQSPGGWLEQFYGEALAEKLTLKGDIVAMTGATLTSIAITEAARRILALHEVIMPFESDGAARSP